MKFNDFTDLLDDVNLQIIDILSKDSSTPFVEIAKRVGISDATVHLRVRRLIDEGIIRRFTLSLNNDSLGYDHLAFVGINIRPGFADQTTDGLSNLEEVLEIHEMHNRFDLFLKIRAKNLSHMRDIVENKIRILPNIVETELMTVLKSSKEKQVVSLKKDGSENGNGVIHVKELKSHTIIHEHDFITSRTENEASLVCSICGSLYCEKCGKLVNETAHDTGMDEKKKKEADSTYLINIQSNTTKKHCRESALMAAAHILICLTQEGKSIEEIAREDFDNNLELVTVWIDYMTAINWLYKNKNDGKWVALDNGKRVVEKILHDKQ